MTNNYENVDNDSDDEKNAETSGTKGVVVLRSYKDDKGNFLYDTCARDLERLNIYKTLKGSKKMYRYVPELGYYRDDGEEYLQQQMRRIVGSDFRRNRFSEVLTMVQTDTLMDSEEFKTPTHLLNLKNGYYDLSSNLFIERHNNSDSSGLYFIDYLPIEYKPKEYFGIDGPCPNIDHFLHQVLGSQEDVNRMYEWIGYHLWRANPLKKVGVFLGGHDTGKTTLSELIMRFLGEQNVSNLSMDAIVDDKFDRVKLYGKLANISGELSPQFLRDTSLIKALSGGDRLSARLMHNQSDFTFEYYGKLTFLANRLPGTYEDDDAFYSRVEAWEFPHEFKDREEVGVDYPYIKNPNILAELTTSDELSGLFIRAVEGLNRVLSRGRFTGSLPFEAKRTRYLSLSDSAKAFLNDAQVVFYGPEYSIERKKLLEDYHTYCSLNKLTDRSDQYFGRVFTAHAKQYGILLSHEGGVPTYHGITTYFA